MKILSFYIRDTQKENLKKLAGSTSEHLRRAIDMYLDSLDSLKPVAISPSKNGYTNQSETN